MVVVSCGDPAAGPGKSAVFLVVEPDQMGAYVDVYNPKVPGRAADVILENVKIKSEKKDTSDNTPLSVYSDVILEQYIVTYWRTDGNPKVPAPVTFAMSGRVPHGGEFTFKDFPILTRDALLQSPLKELAFGGGEGSIHLYALTKFYGHDLAGNAVTTEYNFSLFIQDL